MRLFFGLFSPYWNVKKGSETFSDLAHHLLRSVNFYILFLYNDFFFKEFKIWISGAMD
jgi:hypothetical protein